MRNELIAKVLKEYRKKNHLSVTDVALRLQEQDINVAAKTIYGWESGQAKPSADMLLTLCEMYNITDILSAFGYREQEDFHITASEQRLIEAYRAHPELQEAVNILLLHGRNRRPARNVEHPRTGNAKRPKE
ncbi:MAG: helix-turn-helix domain-containing protein [Roseburia sp.]